MKTIFLYLFIFFSFAANSQDVSDNNEIREHQQNLKDLSFDIRNMVYDYAWKNHHNHDSVTFFIDHFSGPTLNHLPYCIGAMSVISEELEEYNIDNCDNMGDCNSMKITMSRDVIGAPFNINIEFDMERKNGGVILNIWVFIGNNGHIGFYTGSLLPPSIERGYFFDSKDMLDLFEW